MARRRIDWTAQPLGDEPDIAIAERLGVCTDAVRKARSRRGIPAWRKHRKSMAPHRPEWDVAGLGEKSDEAIAVDLGVSRTAVVQARKARGLPSGGQRDRAARDAAIVLLRKAGYTALQVATATGLSEANVYAIWKRKGAPRG